VSLPRGAFANLRLSGDLPGTVKQGRSELAHAEVAGLDIRFGGTPDGIHTGEIAITDLHDLEFVMGQNWKPQVLSGRIRRATANGIHWKLP
jgi:hypothetical protein